MTLPFHGLWMLCSLGAVVFAAAAAAHVRQLIALTAGAVLAVVLASPARLPDPVTLGTLATIAAAIHLFRPRYRLATAAVGGALAGAATALLEVQGVPAVVSPAAAAPLVIVPVWLARTRSSFAPERLCEEGMLAVSVLGVAVAVLPGVLDGWQAATNLSAAAERQPSAAVPVWTFVLLLTSSSLGALYALWSRR